MSRVRNVALDLRWADGNFERLPGLARQLVGRAPRLIFAQAPPAALALKAATSKIPIVFVCSLAARVTNVRRPEWDEQAATEMALTCVPVPTGRSLGHAKAG